MEYRHDMSITKRGSLVDRVETFILGDGEKVTFGGIDYTLRDV